MKYRMLLLIPALLSAGCGTGRSSAPDKAERLTVPAVKQYTIEQQKKAATQLEAACPKYDILCMFVDDYGRMRDQARAALGQKVNVTR